MIPALLTSTIEPTGSLDDDIYRFLLVDLTRDIQVQRFDARRPLATRIVCCPCLHK